ncbi:MAG TPA: M14 family zinc carboxypeptidase [bacterium]|nr:M14 family zinc carboxypeptidase [bacterium]
MPAMPLLADPPPWNAAADPPAPEHVGHSVLGNAVNLYGACPANLLVVAGVHGDESEGIFLAHLLLGAGCPVPLIPCVNPDGALLRQRWNRRNVDLNRNLPTPDWAPEATNPRYPPGSAPASEPETGAFLAALERVRPSTVLSLHSYKDTFIEIERPEAELNGGLNAAVTEYATAVGIERRQSIGYPTPGALGAYGRANGLLILTYELERGRSHGELQRLVEPLLALIGRLDSERFTAP